MKETFFFSFADGGIDDDGNLVISLTVKYKKLLAVKIIIDNYGLVPFFRYAITRNFWRMLNEI